MNIRIRVSTLDGLNETKRFKSLADARKFAKRYVGKSPELGANYAVSQHGDAKVEVQGIALEKLFAESGKTPTECMCSYNEDTGKSYICDYCRLPSTIAYRKREAKRAKHARAREAREYEKREAAERRKGTWIPF